MKIIIVKKKKKKKKKKINIIYNLIINNIL